MTLRKCAVLRHPSRSHEALLPATGDAGAADTLGPNARSREAGIPYDVPEHKALPQRLTAYYSHFIWWFNEGLFEHPAVSR